MMPFGILAPVPKATTPGLQGTLSIMRAMEHLIQTESRKIKLSNLQDTHPICSTW